MTAWLRPQQPNSRARPLLLRASRARACPVYAQINTPNTEEGRQ